MAGRAVVVVDIHHCGLGGVREALDVARGLPQRGGGSGDLIVETRISMPKRVTDPERKLWEQLARESHFSPRD